MALHDELEDSHIRIEHITREAEQLLKPGALPSYDVPRMRTGVPGLDPLLQGGIPYPSIVLLVGPTGTGKTTLGLQFLVEGARAGEQCAYLGGDGAAHLRHFWPRAGGVRFEPTTSVPAAQRVVVDAPADIRQISATGAVIVIAEELRDGAHADGIILLGQSSEGRTLTVQKMRWTDHPLGAHPFEIRRPGGIVLR